MISLIALKRYELSSGRVLLGSARPAVGNFFHRGLSWVEYVLPGLVRVGIRSFYTASRNVARAWLSHLASRAERGLERALSRVRRSAAAPRKGQSSAFLRQVAEHKKSLQESASGRTTRAEE